MKCERVRELLSDYYEGALDFALAEVIKGHLEKCESCRLEFQQMKSLWGMLDSIPSAEPPAYFRQNIISQLQSMQEKQQKPSPRSWRGWLHGNGLSSSRGFLTAAAGLILLAILFMVPQYSDKYASGAFNPSMTSVPHKDNSYEASKDASPFVDVAQLNKEKWMARNSVHNVVWVAIESQRNDQDETIYNLIMFGNKQAGINSAMLRSIDVSVYIVDSGMFNVDAIKNTKPEWKGELTEGTSITIPVAVDKNEATLDILILCRSRGFEFGKFVFLPSGKASDQDVAIEVPGTGYQNVYRALQEIAAAYNVPVIANSNLHVNVPCIDIPSATLAEQLRRITKPVGLDWLCVDGVVYVDRSYNK